MSAVNDDLLPDPLAVQALFAEAAAWRGASPGRSPGRPLGLRRNAAALKPAGLAGSLGQTRPAPARPACLPPVDASREAARQQAIGRRAAELLRDKDAGRLRRLEIAPSYRLRVNGRDLGVFRPAFAYWDGYCLTVEDFVAKGDPDRRLLRALAAALYGLTVRICAV